MQLPSLSVCYRVESLETPLFPFAIWFFICYVILSFGLTSYHKEARLGLKAAIDSFAKLTTDDKASEKVINQGVKLLRDGLESFNTHLFGKTCHPQIPAVKKYFDIVYSTAKFGGKQSRNAILRKLKKMLDALGETKEKEKLGDFLRALISIEKEKPNWTDLKRTLETSTFTERFQKRFDHFVRYALPIIAIIVPIIVSILLRQPAPTPAQ
jgi:ribosomal protein L31